MDRATLTAAPVTLTLNGVEYRMSPLTDADMGELERWIQRQVLEVARESLPPLPDPGDSHAYLVCKNEREMIIRMAIEESCRASLDSAMGMNLLSSLQGLARIYWMQLRKHHPQITVSEVYGLLADKGIREKLDMESTVLNAPPPDLVKKKTGKSGVPGRHERRRTTRSPSTKS